MGQRRGKDRKKLRERSILRLKEAETRAETAMPKWARVWEEGDLLPQLNTPLPRPSLGQDLPEAGNGGWRREAARCPSPLCAHPAGPWLRPPGGSEAFPAAGRSESQTPRASQAQAALLHSELGPKSQSLIFLSPSQTLGRSLISEGQCSLLSNLLPTSPFLQPMPTSLPSLLAVCRLWRKEGRAHRQTGV